jgi:hypothetical protein
MSVKRTFYCEGPDCDIPRDEPVADEDRKPANASTATGPPHLIIGWIRTRERFNGEDYMHDFCGWGCLMKFAAQQPVPSTIRWEDITGGDDA